MTARLRLTNITKIYPGVRANDGISLEVAPGRVLAILGENGAGKSTLMKIIYGAVQPDSGTIEFDGLPAVIRSPNEARTLGIAMVHQHFALFETLTVAQNVLLGLEEKITLAEVSRRVTDLGRRYGLEVAPDVFVADLTVGERQRVEIIRALMTNPRLLILDEPTSVLTPQAVKKLFATLKQLAAEGLSILFITHKLDEIRDLADACVILRQGRVVTTVDPKKETTDTLARLMIGGELPKLRRRAGRPGGDVLVVKKLQLAGGEHACGLQNVRLSVRAGEIVGIAGISGNGQSRLLGVLAGEIRPDAGAVILKGRNVTGLSAAKRRLQGLRYVPEERLGHGTVPELTLEENTLLTGDRLHSHGVIHKHAAAGFTERVIDRFRVASGRRGRSEAQALSGGNLQKFVVGREILNQPSVLIINQPTWGVDVGAATVIHNALLEMRDQGAGLLVVSEEIDELFAICDRIAVMYRGCLSPAVPVESLTVEEIGKWMAGLWVGCGCRPGRESSASEQKENA